MNRADLRYCILRYRLTIFDLFLNRYGNVKQYSRYKVIYLCIKIYFFTELIYMMKKKAEIKIANDQTLKSKIISQESRTSTRTGPSVNR